MPNSEGARRAKPEVFTAQDDSAESAEYQPYAQATVNRVISLAYASGWYENVTRSGSV